MSEHLIHNEQVKLLATLLNTVGAASIAVGTLPPIAALIYRDLGLSSADALSRPPEAGFWPLVAGSCVQIVTAGVLHLLARRVLRGMRP